MFAWALGATLNVATALLTPSSATGDSASSTSSAVGDGAMSLTDGSGADGAGQSHPSTFKELLFSGPRGYELQALVERMAEVERREKYEASIAILLERRSKFKAGPFHPGQLLPV